MIRKIALFANGDVGLSIAKYLINQPDEVAVLFLAGQYQEMDKEILDVFAELPKLQVIFGDFRQDLIGNLKLLNDQSFNTIITVYWPYIIPKEVLDLAELSVNFHPALLPRNRGWYPHVHNLIDGSPAGVTLHKLTTNADEGDIWAQKVVEVEPWDCAGDLYKKLQHEITKLFIETWPQIKYSAIEAQPQDNSGASYHSKKKSNLWIESSSIGITQAQK